jgi:hypothetical protein
MTMVSKRIPSMSVPIKCENCSVVHVLDNPNDIDRSFGELRAAGWLDCARKAAGRERWAWRCAACRPQGSPGLALTTAHLMPRKRGEDP